MKKRPSEAFLTYVLDQLGNEPQIDAKAMFGGIGLYWNEIFFGIVHQGQCYLKTHPQTVANFHAYGMRPFQPNPKQTLKHYYAVPVEVLENASLFYTWVQQAAQQDDFSVG